MEINKKAKLLAVASKRATGKEPTGRTSGRNLLEAPYRNNSRPSGQKALAARVASARGDLKRSLGRLIRRTMSRSLLVGQYPRGGLLVGQGVDSVTSVDARRDQVLKQQAAKGWARDEHDHCNKVEAEVVNNKELLKKLKSSLASME
uniref:Uncharacterized protein n=1 Tax=Nelumbo nucifera TaxID=4432 RepID=A0A822XJA8_NELNU|nr:TPA_asm: hypothetical protein HUJ06_021820 [Nelumbo nucifera]